ncbi:hypothetical protein B296_00023498 [Ensete ventricosum]|uniref:Uncharacterized protein n=1 Tax=Ensete ventricosum TaxID=4639 RepID=A0A427AHU3_ENSVE|nr:hypothetical protein B296_00023498 [Ensete ventricosum]
MQLSSDERTTCISVDADKERPSPLATALLIYNTDLRAPTVPPLTSLPNPFTGMPNKLQRRSGRDLDTQFPLRISETAADKGTKRRKREESQITPNAIRSETTAPSEWKNPAKQEAIWRGLRDRPPGSEESTWIPCLPPFPPPPPPPPPPPIATLE